MNSKESMLSQSSTFLENSEVEPRDLRTALSADGHEEDKLILRRKRSNVSELSKIISGIRDDHEIDNSEYEAYKCPVVEETLLAQLDQVSKNITQNSGPQSLQEEASLPEDEPSSDHPIDGGFAFWQAFLAMLVVFLTWGANAAFGVFLNLYLHNQLFKSATMYDFALMGGLVVALANILCPFTVIMVKIFGQTWVLIAGIVIQTVGYLLAAECKQFWQLFLCQGVMVGLSFALIFIPGTLVIPTWFDKHLATAMGIAVSGAGLGGLVFSFILNKIISITGDQKWALRAAGLINLVISVFATIFMRVRNKKKLDYKETLSFEFLINALRVVFDVKIFKSYALVLTALWFGIVLMGYVIILYSMAPYATSEGLTAKQSANVLAVLNALQVVGRPAIGRLGDFLGRNNTSLLICCYAGILLLAFWLNAKDYVSIMVLAALVGAPAGVGSTMAQSMGRDVLKFDGVPYKLPAAWSGMNIVVAFFALPAEVIALKLKKGTTAGSYRNAQIFTACAFFFGAIILVVNREWLVRQTLKNRRQMFAANLYAGRTSYLKSEDAEHKLTAEEVEALELRIKRYDRLLSMTPIYFIVRAFYPIRV
ncbi:hypothetical protein PUMCH_002982 [Australozyma saopauloensis]|uniref:Major facilitator superfamily (MFS) profile domain-containing protein n=1 Tax=Australozyma saopauloensis TaxID=291208 RepID=A0AAX4HBB8_9ASCO|nr:hypothetical protein PUMCH_002982 [[Candida] saopauloensis]